MDSTDRDLHANLSLSRRIRFFFSRFRRLPIVFWAVLATIFGIADFLTWSVLSDISPSERVRWTLGIVFLALAVTVFTVARTPTTDEKMARARMLHRAAREAYEKKLYAETKKLLQQAVQYDPERVDSWGLLGRTLIRLGELQESILALTRALSLTQVNRALYLHCRGQAYALLGQYGRALDDFEESLKEEPNRTNTLRWRALTWAYLGRYDNAMQDIEAALKLKPLYICGHATKAVILHRYGQIEKAQNEIKRCSALQPKDADDFYCLAQAYNQIGDRDQTLLMLRLAFERDPKYRVRLTLDPLFENLAATDSDFRDAVV
ncbi:MAG: hypothetical protein KatS3mg054_1189 [Chloroflexus sp.]|nr:MAG: hypothetical protein KatS3mg054_1189 [Chloroflexus sp.]